MVHSCSKHLDNIYTQMYIVVCRYLVIALLLSSRTEELLEWVREMLPASTLCCCCQPPQPPAACSLPPRAADTAAGHLPDILLPATMSGASARLPRTSPAPLPMAARSAPTKTMTPRYVRTHAQHQIVRLCFPSRIPDALPVADYMSGFHNKQNHFLLQYFLNWISKLMCKHVRWGYAITAEVNCFNCHFEITKLFILSISDEISF